MGLQHSFKTARKRIASLDGDEREALFWPSAGISGNAQEALTKKAAPVLANCMACQGLCCRNIHPADIITEWDLVYLLTMAPQIDEPWRIVSPGRAFSLQTAFSLKTAPDPASFPTP
jgi:hypothetical protein